MPQPQDSEISDLIANAVCWLAVGTAIWVVGVKFLVAVIELLTIILGPG